jgi:hypothetical protein
MGGVKCIKCTGFSSSWQLSWCPRSPSRAVLEAEAVAAEVVAAEVVAAAVAVTAA